MISAMIRMLACGVLAATLLSACAEGPFRRSYSGPEETADGEAVAAALKNVQAIYSRGDYGNALLALGKIEENNLSPAQKAEYWNLKGLIRLGEKNYSHAIINFKRAGVHNPHRSHAAFFDFNLATAWYESGKKDEARRILERMDPTNLGEVEQKKLASLKAKLGMGMDAGAAAAPEATTASDESTAGSSATSTAAIPAVSASPEALPTATPEASPPAREFGGRSRDGRVGVLLPLSGKYENFGKKAQRAIELAFQTSTDPRVKNYELVPIDSGETPEAQLEALRKLVEDEQVIAIIGPILSKTFDAIQAKVEFYQVPLLSLAAVQGKPSPHVFYCSVSVKDQISKVVSYAMNQRGYRRFAVLAPGNLAGEEMAHVFWDEVAARKGEIRAFELYDPELTDFRDPVDKTIGLYYTDVRGKELAELAEKRKELNIKKKTMKTIQYFNLPPMIDFDAVFIADEAKTVGQIIPTFAYRDAKGLPFLGISTWNSNQLLQRAGDLVEGAFFPVAYNTKAPSNETRRFTEIYKNTWNANPGELDAIAFDAAALVIAGLSESPSSRSDFMKTLERMSGIPGATGTIAVEDHRCRRNLALFGVKRSSFEVLPDSYR
jgi:ABC-type branched-subunit amino acid transport system substrate-binding protein